MLKITILLQLFIINQIFVANKILATNNIDIKSDDELITKSVKLKIRKLSKSVKLSKFQKL